ncbi:hypothetical protein Dfri01_59280 [Dyadobacter frigoris]|uniref:hypothetical protein n=1 Tax=Dyadobacter frigoris TaxID=2576211 RepID=UPI0024A25CB8|nr:hypothetical protein [Dyadobacter frigoris]GLU56467.1 hypothetical protein Dfri01_59280 [Dyadobacter frigoris]
MMIFKDKTRAEALDKMATTLKNGWNLTVHFKEKLINMYKLPSDDEESKFLDEWEIEKKFYNAQFSMFVDDFGISALIASAKNHDDSAPHEIWFINDDTIDNLCFVHEIEFNMSNKLIEVLISR